jgi:hypothetical protein
MRLREPPLKLESGDGDEVEAVIDHGPVDLCAAVDQHRTPRLGAPRPHRFRGGWVITEQIRTVAAERFPTLRTRGPAIGRRTRLSINCTAMTYGR